MGSYTQKPRSQQYTDAIANEDLIGGFKTGLGRAGKSARQIIGNFDAGTDVSKFLGADLASINQSSAANKRAIQARLSKSLAFQPPTVKALANEEAMNEAELTRQQSVASGVQGLRALAYQTLQQAINNRDARAIEAAKIRLAQLEAAASANRDSYDRKPPSALLSGLLGGAAGIASAYAGKPK